MSDPPADEKTDRPTPRLTARESSVLFWSLVVVGVVLALAVIPGVFIIDEPNYLSTVVGVRHGTWFVPGTDGLPPTRELVAFDPEAPSRSISTTPVASLAPPLYAVLALPVSWFGWTSLFFLNVVGFVLATWVVYVLVREQGGSISGAVLGATLFGLGGFSIEYALGMWPHMVSVAFTSAALLAATRSIDRRSLFHAFLAGCLSAVAVGVREQSIIIVGGLGIGIFLLSRPRLRSIAMFAVGAAIPLLSIAAINAERLGVFHPLPKLVTFTVDVREAAANTATTGGPAAVLWAKVIDFRRHPPFSEPRREQLFRNEPVTGVPLVGGGVVKKALLQSAPWIALAFTVLVVGWRGPKHQRPVPLTFLLLAAGVVVPMLAVVAAAGFGRSDGLAYNQRYFLEMVPVFAVLVGLSAGSHLRPAWVALGGVAAIVGAVAMFSLIPIPHQYTEIAVLPLLLALASAVAGIACWKRSAGVFASVVLGLALGWSVLIHLVDDVRASRARRSSNLAIFEAIEPHIPRGAALFTYGGGRDAVGPLMLTKDVLLLDAWADEGADAVRMIDALHARGQRVFVRPDGFPPRVLANMMDRRRVVHLRETFPFLAEIVTPS
jgi:hypothetical protein